MTETSPVSFQTHLDDPLEKRVGDGRADSPARGDQNHRSGDGASRAGGRRRANC